MADNMACCTCTCLQMQALLGSSIHHRSGTRWLCGIQLRTRPAAAQRRAVRSTEGPGLSGGHARAQSALSAGLGGGGCLFGLFPGRHGLRLLDGACISAGMCSVPSSLSRDSTPRCHRKKYAAGMKHDAGGNSQQPQACSTGTTGTSGRTWAHGVQAMQALRDHWQAVVVDRLMRLAAAVGEPLAQRALSPAQLAERRAAQPGPASERIACADAGSPAAARAGPPLDPAVLPTPLLQRGVAAALAGAVEVPGCDTSAGEVTSHSPNRPQLGRGGASASEGELCSTAPLSAEGAVSRLWPCAAQCVFIRRRLTWKVNGPAVYACLWGRIRFPT